MSTSGFDEVRGALNFMSSIGPNDILELEGERKSSPAPEYAGVITTLVSTYFSWKDWYTGTTQKQAELLTSYVTAEMDQLESALQSDPTIAKDNFSFIEHALESIQKGILRHRLIESGDAATKRQFAATSSHVHEILHTLRKTAGTSSSPKLISPTNLAIENLTLGMKIPVSIDGKLFDIETNKDIPNRFSALNVVLDAFDDEQVRSVSSLEIASDKSGKASIALEGLKKFMNFVDFDSAYNDLRSEYPNLPEQSETLTFNDDKDLNGFICRFFLNELKKEMIAVHPELSSDEIAAIMANTLPWLSFNAVAFEVLKRASEDGGTYHTRLPKSETEEGQTQGESLVSVLGKEKAIRIKQIQQIEWVDMDTSGIAASPTYHAEVRIPFDGSTSTFTIDQKL